MPLFQSVEETIFFGEKSYVNTDYFYLFDLSLKTFISPFLRKGTSITNIVVIFNHVRGNQNYIHLYLLSFNKHMLF